MLFVARSEKSPKRTNDEQPSNLSWAKPGCPIPLLSALRRHASVSPMEPDIVIASQRGLCAGVSHAIEIVDLVLDREGAPIYVRHEIVHNRHVVERLRERGRTSVA